MPGKATKEPNKEFGEGILPFEQLGPSAWERLRSKSGLKGGRPVAFTVGERGRGECVGLSRR